MALSDWQPRNLIMRILRYGGENTKPVEQQRATAAGHTSAIRSAHLKAYLDYYTSLKEPHYAVLITGGWGTGKTYQVRRAMGENGAYYVSLFGLTSSDDVVAATYTAMFPRKALAKKVADSVGQISAQVPGVGSLAVNGLTSGLVGAFLRQEVNNDKPIIFDDLERCRLDVKETLGIINLYVEHHGSRVIVIAHDEKMTGEFSEAKEKIFGQTIRVEPEVGVAFDAFIRANADGFEKEMIQNQREDVIGVFAESGVESLRTLEHVIEDLGRLIRQLGVNHRANSQAMLELFRLFSAFNIEWREGRIKSDDLFDRKKSEIGYVASSAGDGGGLPKIVAANKRYGSVDLTSTLLQDGVLRQMLVEGRYDSAAIQASLDSSSYFLKTRSAAPWQVVIEFDRLDDDVVADGLARMQKQFDGREVADSGEMLHIFALQMLMASKGILDRGVDTVAQECKRYIDDLLAKGELPPRGPEWRWYDTLERSSFGIAYWVGDDYGTQFHSVYDYLLEARGKAFENKFPELVPELLRTMEADGQLFFDQICYTRSGKNKYAAVPILAAIKPADFVAAWMRSPKKNWYWISSALNERYKAGHLQGEFKIEAPWIQEVVSLLKTEADKVSGLAKLRIQRTIPNLAD